MSEVKPILAIETSEAICSAALYFSTDKYYASSIKLKHSHSEKLFETIDFLFHQAEIERNQISSVAVSGGPGSFTGLRIGMAAAKGIARGTGVPLIVVPTFEALAYQLSSYISDSKEFIIANKVNKDEVYYSKFKITNNTYIFTAMSINSMRPSHFLLSQRIGGPVDMAVFRPYNPPSEDEFDR